MPFAKIIEVAEAVAQGKAEREDLACVLKEFVELKTPIDGYIVWSDESYYRHQVYASSNVEVVITCWDEEQKAEPHDHGGSWGMVVPYDGFIVNRLYKIIEENKVVEIGTKVQRPGEVLELSGKDIHAVSSGESKTHISVHCYFPPIVEMNKYQVIEREPSANLCVDAPLGI